MKKGKSYSLEQVRCGELDDNHWYTIRTFHAAKVLVEAKTDEEMAFAKKYVTVMVKDMVEMGYDADDLYADIAVHLNVDDLGHWMK